MIIRFDHRLDAQMARLYWRWYNEYFQMEEINGIKPLGAALPPVSIEVAPDGRNFTIWSRISEEFINFLHEEQIEFSVIG